MSRSTIPWPKPQFTIAEAQLVSLFMQSFAFGIHAVVFAICMHRWFRRSKMPGLNTKPWPWVFIAITLFIIGAGDVALNLYHNLSAFVLFKGRGGASFQFRIISDWINIVRTVLYFLNATLSDAALIYRCWIVYANWKLRWVVVIIPSLLWIGATTCAIVDVYCLSTLHKLVTIPHDVALRPYLFAAYSSSLVLNCLVTGLIVHRMWKLNKQTSTFTRQQRFNGTERLKYINRIFVQSALLYTVSVGISVILEMASNDAFYGTTDVSVELAGITFDLIIIRTWTETPRERSAAFTGIDSFMVSEAHAPLRPRFDFLANDPFRAPSPIRTSTCQSDRVSIYTTASKYTTTTTVTESQKLPKLCCTFGIDTKLVHANRSLSPGMT
ncbi:hypothetical protein DAEQUDRAFT_709506 [Daedalea quercina L-15889]|uniref:Uncharacterized protein n=1 Tax=Daedalea quercina L-15889 TaxID=1314783 RepID=A0A165QQD1_9APHY|nr:hypothetical protein DAEQUDRAFT_709506 [Daedalea quercina L-15889]